MCTLTGLAPLVCCTALAFAPPTVVAFGVPQSDTGPGTSLVIRVLDPQNLPVPGALVDIVGRGARLTVATDALGLATIRADIPLRIDVRAPGFEPVTRMVTTAPIGTFDVRLSPAVVRSSVDVVLREAPLATLATGTALAVDRTAARTVFDAIEALVPGVSITRRGVMGYGIATNGTGAVSIGGIGGQPNTGVLVVVDGRPDVQALMGHPLPDSYTLADAQVVRVTEGPASVLYGSNAMGGVVDITSARPGQGTHGRLSSSMGSFGTGQHRALFGMADQGRYLTVTAAVDHTRGDRPASAYRGETLTLGAGTSISPRWTASLRGRFTDFRVEDPGPVTAPLADSAATVDRGGFSLDLDNASARTSGYARVYGSFGHHVITDGFRSVDRMTGIRFQQSLAVGERTVLDAGADVTRFGGRAENVHAHLDYGEHRGTGMAVFARGRHAVTAAIDLRGGIRYDRDSLVGKATVVPEAGVSWRASERMAVSFTVGRGFRNPTIRELFLFPAPNPSLRPEQVWHSRLRLDVRPHSSLTGWVAASYARLDSLIVTLGRFPNLSLQNSGSAVNRGVEGMLAWRPVPAVQVSAGYAYLRSSNLAPFVPSQKLTWAVDLRLPRVSLNVTGMSVGQRWGDDRHTVTLSRYTSAALRATVPAGRRVSVFGIVDNLLNQTWQVLPGYAMPGINASAGMTWSF
jgi:iron complex outermembrane receptor protein